MPDSWKEGARANSPTDSCPGCGVSPVYFSSDFRKFGKQSVRVCTACKGVFVNGKREGDLEVAP